MESLPHELVFVILCLVDDPRVCSLACGAWRNLCRPIPRVRACDYMESLHRKGYLSLLKQADHLKCNHMRRQFDVSAGMGHIKILRHYGVLQRGCNCANEVLCGAAHGGHLNILREANIFVRIDTHVMINVINGGHLRIMKWAWIRAGVSIWANKWSVPYWYTRAIIGGHLDILIWLKDSIGINARDIPSLTETARSNGHYDIVRWLVEID